MDISTGQLKINWVSQTVYNNMDFSRLSPTTCANKLIIFAVYSPFLAPALCGCALMTVESSDRFSISASSFKNRKIRSRGHHHAIYKSGCRPFSRGYTAQEDPPIPHHFGQAKTWHCASDGHPLEAAPSWNAESYP